MKGDFTRNTFDPTKHFIQVFMQQGRVQLDADWNEQAAILLHYLQTLAVDLIGPYGGPGDGFLISQATDAEGNVITNDFMVAKGHYYVDGILCENEDNISYLHQPNLSGLASLEKDESYLVYLDVWERHISYLEDGDDSNIREVALGGPDTATRAKVVWQVKCIPIAITPSAPPPDFQSDDGDKAFLKLLADSPDHISGLSSGQLRARAKQAQPPSSPCVIHPDARYRGAENQLYRVEIHTGSIDKDNNPTKPTFKWSRENGSVVFPIVAPIASGDGKTTVTLAHLGHDDKLGLREGDWVEIVDDDYTLQNRAEPLLKVQTIDRDAMMVTLDGDLPQKVGSDLSKHPLLRRWDYQEKKDRDPKQGGLPFSLGADKAVVIMEKDGEDGVNWFVLEDGVQIQFQPGGEYRTGDYWLIPARTATGDVEWPGPPDNPKAAPPHGVEHHYAPLASISVDAVTGNVVVMPQRHRRVINQLWSLEP